MSNALCLLAQTTTPATSTASAPSAGGAAVSPILMAALTLGVLVLLGWAVLRLARPRPLTLADAPGRPNRLHPLAVLGALVGWQLLAGGYHLLLARWYGLDPRMASPPLFLAIPVHLFGAVVWLALSLVVARFSFRGGLRRGLGLDGRHWLSDGLRGVLTVLAVLPLVVGAMLLASRLLPSDLVRQHPSLGYARQAGGGWLALVVLSVVVMAPLAEEVFFRGLVQSVSRRYGIGPWPAIVVTSALFAGVHWHEEPQAVPALFILSIALGYVYERTGRLVAPVIAHALFNGLMLTSALAQ